MITNERQYRITKSQSEKFQSALAQMSDPAAPSIDVHPLIWEAQRNSLASQLSDLQTELREYEVLRSGKKRAWVLHSVEELPQALIQARIVAGMSQKDLAEHLGLKEQQFQRYEASNYSGASWARLSEVMRVLGVSLRGEFTVAATQISPKAFVKRLAETGIDEGLLYRHLLPSRLAQELYSLARQPPGSEGLHSAYLPFADVAPQPRQALHEVAACLSPVFGLTSEELLSPTRPLRLDLTQVGSPRFKVKRRSNAPRVAAYTLYAHYLALHVLQATSHLPRLPLPENSREAWQAISHGWGEVTFETALHYVWSLGIPVLPLAGSGGFHGACWRVNGRNIIVLKQTTPSLAAWLQDLLHELWHALQDPGESTLAVIEEEPTSEERLNSPEERSADQFAATIGLNGQGDALVELCIQRANGRIPALKQAVRQVAAERNAPADRLANYLAYRISTDPDLRGENWWGTAATFQQQGDPCGAARNALREHLDWNSLNPFDGELLRRALETSDDESLPSE